MCKTIVITFILVSGIRSAAAQTDSATKAHQIIKIEQALADALPGDTIVWSKYLDPAWYIITEDGSGLNRTEFLNGFGPFPKGYSGHINVTKPVLTFHGNIAVIHLVSDEYENVLGQQLHTTYGTADTYYKTDTSWMMIGSQVFEIPQLPPVIKVGEAVLAEYAGTYQMADKKAVLSVRNDTLFIQKNNGTTEALLSETTNVFFRQKDTRGRKIFVKNEAGEILMLERRNGQDLVWKRDKKGHL